MSSSMVRRAPSPVLWTDPKGEWRPLVEMLRGRLEELLVLGDFAPDVRCGPAIWIRCLVDEALDQPFSSPRAARRSSTSPA